MSLTPEPAPAPESITFRSGDADCTAQFYSPAGATGPRPCVVMAHGLGGTVDSGLEEFARAYVAAGYAAFAFDFRGFGRSGGEPRQVVRPAAQQDDYRAALRSAARQPGVDPARMVLWGVSLSGGHVLEVARTWQKGAAGIEVAALIAQVPLVDGRAAAVLAAKQHSPVALARSTAGVIGAKLGGVIGRPEPLVPLIGPPGSSALLSLDGYEADYTAVAGPTWRNEIGVGIGGELGTFRPGAKAAELADRGVPALFQIADHDRSAPPQAAAEVAFAARAEVRHYPGDHFSLFTGGRNHDRAVNHSVAFLRRHVPPTCGARAEITLDG